MSSDSVPVNHYVSKVSNICIDTVYREIDQDESMQNTYQSHPSGTGGYTQISATDGVNFSACISTLFPIVTASTNGLQYSPPTLFYNSIPGLCVWAHLYKFFFSFEISPSLIDPR